MWGDFSSFLEMAFAINVLFFTWQKPGEILTNWLIGRARLGPGRLEGDIKEVSERIYTFQERCEKVTPRWRWTSGIFAFVILMLQLIMPAFHIQVVGWGQVLLFLVTFPIVGAALHVGGRALGCMMKNRKALAPQDTQMGALDVKEIAKQIVQSPIPGEDGSPSDEDG